MLCDSDISPMQKMHTYNLCDSCMGAMRFMHNRLFLSGMTDSVMRLYESMRFVNQKIESSKYLLRIVVILPHYPKYPVNLYFCIIDIPFGIANLPFRIDSGKFGYTTGISGSTPSSGNMEYPLQWKLRVDPHSGNMVLIRQTPAVEISNGK
jgi:hypothetical protein